MPASRPNCRSRGVATAEAIVSGLAPGSVALTEIVGKSTWGSDETGRKLYARIPARATAAVKSDVPTGRRINRAERFISPPPPAALRPGEPSHARAAGR